jgi:hypothetical protein
MEYFTVFYFDSCRFYFALLDEHCDVSPRGFRLRSFLLLESAQSLHSQPAHEGTRRINGELSDL